MLWFIFALVGAFLDATYYALVKRFQKGTDSTTLASGFFLICSMILFAIVFINGFPTIGSGFYYSVLATVVLNVVAVSIYLRALRYSNLSAAVPFLSLTPAFLIISAYVFLNEFPTIQGIIGIVIIVLGLFCINFEGKKIYFNFSYQFFLKNKGVISMVVVAIIYSISSSFDKLVVLNSDSFFGSAVVYLLLGVSFAVFSIYKNGDKIIKTYKTNLIPMLLIGVVLALIEITINTAYSMQYASYVIAVKRLSVLFTMLFASVIFKEKSMIRKTIGAVIVVAGAVIILFS